MKIMSPDQKFEQMTQSQPERLILGLAVPTIISMLVTTLYNMADAYFVGKINTSASGAIGVAFSAMALIQAIGFFFGQGAGTNISRELGARRVENAEKLAATSFFSALAAGVILAGAGLLFLHPFTVFLGATNTILPYAADYLRIILIGAPLMAGSLVLNNLFRFVGNAFYGMVGLVAGAILNVGLDPVFIFTLHMGIAGAALATVISQLFGFILLLIGNRRGDNVRIHLHRFTPNRWCFSRIVRGGAPSFFRQGIGSVAFICLNTAAGPYGDAAIAAMTIVTKIMNLSNSIIIGLGQGFQPVCGFNYGARLFIRVKQSFWFCVKLGTAFLLVVGALQFIFASQLIEIFLRGDPEVLRIGALALRLRCVTVAFSAWCIISNMSMQTIGRVYSASFLGMARQGIFLIPLVLLLPGWFGLLGIQIAQPIADIITFIVAIPLQSRLLHELNSPIPSGEVPSTPLSNIVSMQKGRP